MQADSQSIDQELKAYQTGHWLSDFANFSSIVFNRMMNVNWAGFYLDDGQQLILGPFCGKPACTPIAYHRGVCGDAFSKKVPILVPDVHQYPGHIACDSASKSELVIPLILGHRPIGVFDIDSPELARFSPKDQEYLSDCLATLLRGLKSPDFFEFRH